MVNKRKKYNARFAPARIKKIMQKDEEIGKVAAAVPVIISRALELFVESLVTKASEVTKSRNARTLTPAHIKASILQDERLSFLKDTVSNVPDVVAEDDAESTTGNIRDLSRLPRRQISSGRRLIGQTRSNGQCNNEDYVDGEESDSSEEPSSPTVQPTTPSGAIQCTDRPPPPQAASSSSNNGSTARTSLNESNSTRHHANTVSSLTPIGPPPFNFSGGLLVNQQEDDDYDT